MRSRGQQTPHGARYAARQDDELRARVLDRFASRLKVLSQERGVEGSRELARVSGLGIGTVRNLLLGKSAPSLLTMMALVQALDLRSLDELLGPLPTHEVVMSHPTASSNEAK